MTGHRFDPTILREYDIRGIIGETLGPDDARAIGRGFATLLRRAGGQKVAIGYDGRISSPMLEHALCEGLTAVHDGAQVYGGRFGQKPKGGFPRNEHPVVRTHPVTGRKSLYLSSHAGEIVGWPMPEARGYLRDLIEHATQREFVYTHKWRVDDLVMWDNRQTMHRARPFPAHEPRDMRRTTLAGDGPTAEQVAA